MNRTLTKIISTDIESDFQKELNGIYTNEFIEVISVQYNAIAFYPDEQMGWSSTIFHNALVIYKEKCNIGG